MPSAVQFRLAGPAIKDRKLDRGIQKGRRRRLAASAIIRRGIPVSVRAGLSEVSACTLVVSGCAWVVDGYDEVSAFRINRLRYLHSPWWPEKRRNTDTARALKRYQ
ncbi:hypothetical protein KM043_010996 [Ampulex compressa]|nr:hypothetical protein KM043_010996 [Ampulex compressa]